SAWSMNGWNFSDEPGAAMKSSSRGCGFMVGAAGAAGLDAVGAEALAPSAREPRQASVTSSRASERSDDVGFLGVMGLRVGAVSQGDGRPSYRERALACHASANLSHARRFSLARALLCSSRGSRDVR